MEKGWSAYSDLQAKLAAKVSDDLPTKQGLSAAKCGSVKGGALTILHPLAPRGLMMLGHDAHAGHHAAVESLASGPF